jgi:MFS family permease
MNKTQRFTLAATSLGLFIIYLDALIVNVALPVIQSDFKVGEAGLQWVVTAYSLGMTIAIHVRCLPHLSLLPHRLF